MLKASFTRTAKISRIFAVRPIELGTSLSLLGTSPFLKKGCPGWGANPGPLIFIYFLIFTTLPLSHSGSS
jgi:hypothetical protein